MKLINMQVEDYINLVASEAPAPGGGSASALCGAQGIGLIAMVAKLTAGKEKFKDYHAACKLVIPTADFICKELAGQVDIDAEAYKGITRAFKMSKESDEQKAVRKKAIADATLYATEIPLETMRLGMQGLECTAELMGNYYTNCASDVGCGVYGLLSCIRGAWLNVLINVDGIVDGIVANKIRCDGEVIINKAEILAANLIEQV